MGLTRRQALGSFAGAAAAGIAPPLGAQVAPNWSSVVEAFRVPDWFRDAKFGIWAHWSAQCVPEFGDWYGRKMYVEGDPFYDHHIKHYGHPADRGFLEIENAWKAENWDPEGLIARYKAAGARYFMALANHHDNLDAFDSKYHAWNTLRVGPKRDIVGTWEKVARRHGMRFAVSNHSAHAWHWWQTAYGYDAEGPRAGERYDAFRLTRADGVGKWWEGLDPQELYTGPAMVPPDGIQSAQAMRDWHEVHSRRWMEFAPPENPHHVAKWLLRQQDLVERYRPDMVYFDDYALPFGTVGLEALAHFYRQSIARDGKVEVVATAKQLTAYQRTALVDDVERGFSDRLREEPWQTCTCIGDWHYNRARYDQKSYMPAVKVIQRLCDVVSKNGNLLLSIPMRGDGTIDGEEDKILAGITRWMRRNGDAAIFGSRPWRIYGEGPTKVGGGMFNEGKVEFTSGDVRFTTRKGALYAALLAWPEAPVTIVALGKTALPDAAIERVRLVGGGRVKFERSDAGLTVRLPRGGPEDFVPILRIDGRGLV
ncbi:alpha-L-fucosidase [Sphingomonas sp. DG1-23]|uniref:alpha-L-fucosidase n=1 Tax=Sphingomonas sp. DG1-23 TaxID=3068316 RepID=UPI00273EBB3A|nr:alpha-L-fucosidase [Sphingomonas sp. DG1-23]MDP5280792.1 alpha-L-fucosidase [Sphingomonas sp. DG1-23]